MSAGTLAATFVALYAAHQVGDHWVQTGWQAVRKSDRGWTGRAACLGHTLTLTATKSILLGVMTAATGVRLVPGWVLAGLAVDAVSHYWADRRFTLAGLAARLGRADLYALGAPRVDRDDNPSLGTGAYALDQSWHVGWLFVAAIVVTVGAP